MDVLNLPRPSWMTEDLVLLEEQARRFMAAEYAPNIERWNDAGIYDREVWNATGEAGLLCAAMPEAAVLRACMVQRFPSLPVRGARRRAWTGQWSVRSAG